MTKSFRVHYELARELDPTYANLYFNLALVQSLEKEFDSAIKSLEKFLKISPEERSLKAEELLEQLKSLS